MRILSSRGRAFWMAIAVVAIIVAACDGEDIDVAPTTAAASNGPTTSLPDSSGRPLRIGMVVHVDEPDVDPFWQIISLGALEMAEANHVDLELQGDDDPDVQARILDTMVADGIDGLIVSLAAPEVMKPALDRAAAAGIPVITINSGIEHYRETSALTHVGQDESAAGSAVGERLTAMGLTGDVLCFIQESNNIGLEARCNGVEATYRNGAVQRVRLSLVPDSVPEVVALITSELEGGNFAAVVTLQTVAGWLAADAVIASGTDATVTTFDILPEVFDRIRNGEIAFTVDQRPYLQGSVPVRLLVDYLGDGSRPDRSRPVETGPFIIDATNADEVARETEGIDQRIETRFPS